MPSLADRLRAKAFAAIEKLPGKAGALAHKANDALGRPLADANELEDRKAFATTKDSATVTAGSKAVVAAPKADVAPVIVYCMDKTRRDATKLTDMLDAEKVPYKLSNIQEDPAAQMAVRRDSKGHRLPVVFIAGEVVGGRAELSNLIASGDLKKKVFGA